MKVKASIKKRSVDCKIIRRKQTPSRRWTPMLNRTLR